MDARHLLADVELLGDQAVGAADRQELQHLGLALGEALSRRTSTAPCEAPLVDGGGRTAAVVGATGRQGGAVARHLLRRGWRVRALTRDPSAASARALAGLGADVVRADLEDHATLRPALDGADAAFSVQNGMTSGFRREVEQARRVADAASDVGVGHLVQASAGVGRPTGVPSWDAKVEVEGHLASLGLPSTIVRPMAFMELLADPAYFPAFGTWRIWPRLSGPDRPIGWVAVDDVGAAVARILDEGDEHAGRVYALAADVRSVEACRAVHEQVHGRRPRALPMPLPLFDRFTKRDVVAMWRWLRDGHVDLDVAPLHRLVPDALDVETWMRRRAGGVSPA